MDIIKLNAKTKDYLWGGNNLKSYGFTLQGSCIAEAWSLSFHADGESTCADCGKPISTVITKQQWGINAQRFSYFPVLIKFIDSADNLSVQVHPSDEYAIKNENSYGKTEMWYVASAQEGAVLYVGFKQAVTPTQFSQAIADGSVLNLLNTFKVKKGECYFIPSGTVHAIGKGCTIVEVQQNSNLTYRVYDFNRLGADGKPRQLHIDKAQQVTDFSAYKKQDFGEYLAKCQYFTVKKTQNTQTIKNDKSFTALTVLSNGGSINGTPLFAGDTYFISAGAKAEIVGADGILTYID